MAYPQMTAEKAEKHKVPFGEIGYITYKRTYARKLNENKEDSITEEFHQSIERVIKACRTQLKCGFTEKEENELRYYLMNFKALVAGRFLWQLGTKTVSKLGLASLQNCAFTVDDTPVRPFTWTFDMLMLGSGVGYNIMRENVYQLPKLQRKLVKIVRQDDASADYIVPDTREGWCKLLGKVLKAHFLSGKGFTYSTQLIRGKDSIIKSFGGLASGPEILVEGIEYISEILNSMRGKRLRPIHVLDIKNIIGMIVVSGNVRRSAQLAVGDPDDLEFLRAKRWDLGNIPKWRQYSNNSVACDKIKDLPEEFWEGYNGNGEPYGLINLELSRKCGRLGETQYPDPNIQGYNPCGEQGLDPNETCCLAEFPLPNIKSKSELKRVLFFLYRICKHSLLLKCHHPETEEIVHKNMRMGIGLAGDAMSTEEQQSWLDECYVWLRELDNEYSDNLGIPRSIKLTTIKPGGTSSCMTGITPGWHYGIYQYFIRRITISASSTLMDTVRSHGFPYEFKLNLDGSLDHNSYIVDFYAKYPEGTRLVENSTAIGQMERIKELQTVWSDNSISATVMYKQEELPDIKNWLEENFDDSIKSISFLLHNDHGFAQAPFEEITEKQYKEFIAKTTPITSVEVNETDIAASDIGCISNSCPMK